MLESYQATRLILAPGVKETGEVAVEQITGINHVKNVPHVSSDQGPFCPGLADCFDISDSCLSIRGTYRRFIIIVIIYQAG